MSENLANSPPIWATVLEEKFSKQQKTIETLLGTIVSLQEEKEQQKTTVERLTDRIDELEERVREKGVDLDTEKKLHQWKLETSHELNTLKQQVNHYKPESQSVPITQQIEHLRVQVKDTTQFCRDETECTKKDIDYYKSRMTRLEKNISGLDEELMELTRKHTGLQNDMTALSSRYSSDYRKLSGAICEKQADITITRNEILAPKIETPAHVSNPSAGLWSHLQYHSDTQDWNRSKGKEEKLTLQDPQQWRELLSHSLSTLSVSSNDSMLGSGYLARRKSRDSQPEDTEQLLAGAVQIESSDDLADAFSTPSTSPSSLSINDL
ncbi:coiled-coil domain-containing protein 186-like isoform X2 [Watersipora subatra]